MVKGLKAPLTLKSFNHGQDLDTVLKCYSLGFPLKILLYIFFYRIKLYFLVKYTHIRILKNELKELYLRYRT